MSEHNMTNQDSGAQAFEQETVFPEQEMADNNNEQSAKQTRKRLGPLVMEVIEHAKEPLTAEDVQKHLPELSEAQIAPALRTLYQGGRGKLERVKRGRIYAYSKKVEKPVTRRPRKSKAAAESTENLAAQAAEALASSGAESSAPESPVPAAPQPFNALMSMNGELILSKDGATITLSQEERNKFFDFVRPILSQQGTTAAAESH